jgi:hypothetical protein
LLRHPELGTLAGARRELLVALVNSETSGSSARASSRSWMFRSCRPITRCVPRVCVVGRGEVLAPYELTRPEVTVHDLEGESQSGCK